MRRLLIFLPASNKQTHRVKIRAIPALAVSSSPATRPFAWPARPNLASQIHRIQAPFRRTAARPGPQLRCERVSPTRFSLTGAAFSYGAPAERSVRPHRQAKTLYVIANRGRRMDVNARPGTCSERRMNRRKLALLEPASVAPEGGLHVRYGDPCPGRAAAEMEP